MAGDDVVSRSSTSSVPDGALRLCAMCLEWKPMSDYHNSVTGQFTYCRDCRRAYDRRYYAERGREARLARRRRHRDAERRWMAELKAGVACADCGGTFPIYVMHWDHLPEFHKVGEISSMVSSRKREEIMEELKKCELVCANCHVLRTVVRSRRN